MLASRWTPGLRIALGGLLVAVIGCADGGPTAVDATAGFGEVTAQIPTALRSATDPCTGEPLLFEPSKIKLVYRAEPDRVGGFHLRYHLLQLLTGTAARGTEYRSAQSTLNYELQTRPQGFPVVINLVSQMRLTTVGPAPDIRVRVTYHLTVKANSSTGALEMDAAVADLDPVCTF